MKKTVCALLVLAALFLLPAGCGNKEPSTTSTDTSAPRYFSPASQDGLVFSDKELQFQVLRTLSSSVYDASDIGECLETALRVDEAQLEQGNFESWYVAWNATAERINGIADDCLGRGRKVSAREAYLRCETYYRMAEFYLHGNPSDPRIRDTAGKARECFAKATKLMDNPVEQVRIRYEDTTLPGYFYEVDDSGRKRPLVILQTGFDGTQEELYAQGVAAGLRRGYNVLTFEGPGQGEVLREQNLYFRPDWEKVVTPVVDYALSRKEVDPKKVALWGISMGGYLAPRAAAAEHRLGGLIADPGMDMSVMITGQIGPAIAGTTGDPGFKTTPESVAAFVKENPEDFDEGMYEMMKGNIRMNWFMQNGMYAFGVDSPSGLVLKLTECTLAGLTPKIECPTLICDGEQDRQAFGAMTKDIFDDLECEKQYILFTNAEGAGAHCQMGAMLFGHQVKYGWLDDTFRVRE
ncbi:MAG: alpha/beta hydrolase [Actinobacteria bacterium]|nr:alpha/beta hydrolase [Actinomycetota bacterium]MCG2819973.1 alpha/beta hydrolase [Actinomycetes bacterium]MBU4218406.1 alpha/beta hydrolase [Actinomycetota bacterium]MBU4358750.1 alpha/beta hydrolase [Actinomycetota bacterium]MBU4401785.1 alpha/beta hydrolase [Actinomycetota bacterium]